MIDREEPLGDAAMTEREAWDKALAESPDCGLDTELADLWLNACAAAYQHKPDFKPLGRLFRRRTPMTPGAYELLADLLDPQGAAFKLQDPHMARRLRELDAIARHAKKRAAEKAARTKYVEDSARQIRRYRARLRALGRHLRGQS